MRIAVLAGTGFSGEDLFYKVPWMRHVRKTTVVVLSRIHPDHLQGVCGLPVRGVSMERLAAVFEEARHLADVRCVYDAPAWDPAPDEVCATEQWLGMPFRHLIAMNRLFHVERGGIPVDVRPSEATRAALARYVRWFREQYAQARVEALLTTMEDDLYCLAAWAVAKRMGIRVVGTMVTRFPRRGHVFAEDFERLILWRRGGAKAELQEARACYDPSIIAGDAPERTRGYWDLASIPRRIRDASFARDYESFRRQAVRVHPDEALIIPPAAVARRAADHARRMARRYRVRRHLGNVPEGPFVLFPLHYSEDAQMTFREPFADQVAIVEAAARSLPAGYTLVVKPHPHYMASDLPTKDIARIAGTPGVVLIGPEVPAMSVLERAACVLTINSTTGFEALVHGVPVVATGHDWWVNTPAVRVVHDLDDLPIVLLEAVTRGPRHKEADRFIARAWHNTVFIDGEPFGYGLYGHTDEDGKAMANAIDRLQGASLMPDGGP